MNDKEKNEEYIIGTVKNMCWLWNVLLKVGLVITIVGFVIVPVYYLIIYWTITGMIKF
ncbi:MAG: hypothetical protein NC548_34025 [Lachnospiraceae bacterium]|nr:hypothetical protein [Lachnospiraceae bacterium]